MSREHEPGYEAAQDGAALLFRGGQRFLEVVGKAPGDMLKGIITGGVPGPLADLTEGVREGLVSYSAVLTPKGKMVTDLRLFPGPGGGFLLCLTEAGFEGLVSHFRKYLHPRFAETRDRTEELAMISLVGPGTSGVIREVLGDEVVGGELGLGGQGPNRVRVVDEGQAGPVILLEQDDLGIPGLDLILPAQSAASFQGELEEAGAYPLSPEAWKILRIEAGTPAFGVDMSEDNIPIEAGIHHRAIDYEKGCYTGQEVIIRIRDRGQVNKTLRHVLLGDAPVPEAGTELFQKGVERARGWVTSACRSPRVGQTLAMGYLKRGVEPGDPVQLGSPQGLQGRVKALEEPFPD